MPIGHEKHVGHAAGFSQRHVFLHPPLAAKRVHWIPEATANL